MAIPLVALLALASSPVRAACTSVAQPNILLILLDDVGIEHVSAYGLQDEFEVQDYANTPNFDNWAADDWLTFTNAWSNPICSPTRSTILTGLYGSRTGVGELVGDDSVWGLDPDEIDDTLPKLLKNLGGSYSDYATGAFGKA